MKDNSYLMTTSFVLCFKWTRINQELAGWLTTNSMLLYSKRTIDYNLERKKTVIDHVYCKLVRIDYIEYFKQQSCIVERRTAIPEL